MAIRNIVKYGDETLRKIAKPVEKVNKRTAILIDDMADTMYRADGVGLAAPQVGILKRIIVVDIGDGKLFELVNPEIIESSGEQTGAEGCLSLPNKGGSVKRPMNVKVKAMDKNFKPIEVEGSGLLARALCHEIDHLDGILFIDKVIPGTLEG